MVTADQLLAHVVGDYVLQSDWMARHKTLRCLPALLHAAVYSLPFLVLSPSPVAVFIIVSTHFVIDRWRLARFVCRFTNLMAPAPDRSWAACRTTGYSPDRPEWIRDWLLVIVDNTLHVLINAWALALA
jgi:hypothetical protein